MQRVLAILAITLSVGCHAGPEPATSPPGPAPAGVTEPVANSSRIEVGALGALDARAPDAAVNVDTAPSPGSNAPACPRVVARGSLSARATFDSCGGTLTLDSGAELIIEPGAVESSIEIGIVEDDPPLRPGWRVEAHRYRIEATPTKSIAFELHMPRWTSPRDVIPGPLCTTTPYGVTQVEGLSTKEGSTKATPFGDYAQSQPTNPNEFQLRERLPGVVTVYRSIC